MLSCHKLFAISCLLFAVSSLLLATCGYAETSQQLINQAAFHNGKTVTFEGEAVGDAISNWVNLFDGNAAIGVFTPSKPLLDKITIRGDYNNIGDRVRVTGRFSRACPQHGGDLDLHAESIEIVSPGHAVVYPINKPKIYLLTFLFVAAGIIFLAKIILDKTRGC